MVDRLLASVARAKEGEAMSIGAWSRRFLRELAVQDWVLVFYVLALILGVAIFGEDSAAKTQNLERLLTLGAALVAGLVATRGGFVTRSCIKALVYRATCFAVMLVSYLMLRGLLPVINTGSLDSFLYQLDLRVFGVEPSVWMDQFITPRTTEWFAFFYYSYFILLALHVLPFVFLSRKMKLFAEFSLGFMSLYCVAHLIYCLVPGFGPVRFLTPVFHHQLPSGFWFDRVMEAVTTAGAQKDIFPSLHTAGPTFVLLFSLRHRDRLPFRFTWPVTLVFAVNIIIATMFLRWHYLIDIAAGLTLASTMSVMAGKVTGWEAKRRDLLGLSPIWPEPSKPASLPSPDSSLPSASN
jgi:hypothetical protein